ncbi:MAG: NAD(P)H-dependent oxidoreductase subunit E, partial [Planctomycetales bacterium]|nr:NAD(P)H-dependent oxidoreductase subunit E [Planctomycetales bacterium]
MRGVDLQFVDEAVRRCGREPDSVIPILQSLQDHYRYLPAEAIERVCELTDITPAAITGVSTFYDRFRHRPVGKHIVQVCHGTACHVKGAGLVHDALRQRLNLAGDQDTDAEGRFTLQPVACLGCCTLAPVVQIDDATHGRVTVQAVPELLHSALTAAKSKPARTKKVLAPAAACSEIRIGLGSCCVAQGSGQVYEAVESILNETGAAATLKRVGCVGMCHQTPLVELVGLDGTSKLYSHVQPDSARRIVLNNFAPRGIVNRLWYATQNWFERFQSDVRPVTDQAQGIDVRDPPVCAFLGPQIRLATEDSGHVDPLDLAEYRCHGGFSALQKCVDDDKCQQVIESIRTSGLRGRGGAGFPTHAKWTKMFEQQGETKYVICNGDEGDPGAFMDRMLLESFPYRIIEGLAIAAVTVGAKEAIFYIRAEYPLAVARIRKALARCEEEGVIGASVLGSNHALKMSVKEGAGAFICGEETALIHSLEGGRGTPRLRPPFPVESGLHGYPTLINNVETLACIPWILRNGADRFAALGTATSKGTKVFALAGKIQRGGLIEVPMGVTLREIVEHIGGGVAPGRTFKAVQVGGPSGGCVPAELADIPVDYERLREVGAIMGSGGLVVLDDQDCMVDIARYFLRFTQDQSCGKCTFC